MTTTQNNNTSTGEMENRLNRPNKAELFAQLEELLLIGKREEACNLASTHKEWPIALLISSNCSGMKYQEVARAYAEYTFPSVSPMHLASYYSPHKHQVL